MDVLWYLLGYKKGLAGSSGGGGESGGSSADVRYVTFMSHDGTVELGKKAVAVGDDCADPIERGLFDTPTKESTAQYDYTFVGWARTVNGAWDETALDAVTEDRTVYAAYASSVRYYTITYYDSDGTTVLKTERLAYGAMPLYTPEKDGYGFEGWNPQAVAVTGDASYVAVWAEKLTFANASWADIARISEAGEAANYFAIGDTKVITYGSYPATVRIVGFDHDDLADGSGKAGMSLLLDQCDPTASASWYNVQYPAIDTIVQNKKSNLPPELQSVIKSVTKAYETTKTSGNAPSTSTVTGYLWIPSVTELNLKTYIGTAVTSSQLPNYVADLGSVYSYFNTVDVSKAEAPLMHNSANVNYWIRTLWRNGVADQPLYWSTNDRKVRWNTSSTAAYYFRLGFCI